MKLSFTPKPPNLGTHHNCLPGSSYFCVPGLDDLSHRSLFALDHRIRLEDERIKGFERRLESLNPLGVLKRGYAVVTRKPDGVLIHKTEQVHPDDEIQIRVSDGQFGAVISKDKES